MAALYEIADEIAAAERDLSEMLGNEVITEEEYSDTLAAIYSERQIKESSVIAYVKNLKAEQAMFKAESDKLLKKAKSAAKKAEGLEVYLLAQMLKAGQASAGEGIHTAKIKRGAFRCEVSDVCALEPRYQVWTSAVNADKRAITAAIKAGEEIKGAAMVQAPDSVRI